VSRDWLLFLDDLIASAEKIGRMTEGMDAESFTAHEAIHDAVLMNLLMMGEAVKNLPESG